MQKRMQLAQDCSEGALKKPFQSSMGCFRGDDDFLSTALPTARRACHCEPLVQITCIASTGKTVGGKRKDSSVNPFSATDKD
jgi:hypothetical protein